MNIPCLLAVGICAFCDKYILLSYKKQVAGKENVKKCVNDKA